MALSKTPLLSHASNSEDNIGSSNPDTMNLGLDLELGSVYEQLKKRGPGVWRFPTNPDLCCIYRVPNGMYEKSPEAYTPQLVLIGPLHLSLKSPTLKSAGNITHRKLMDYLNMEEQKRIYLEDFTRRFEGEEIINKFTSMIKEDEDMIRASYSESTDWIESKDFVDMILHDSVFILCFKNHQNK